MGHSAKAAGLTQLSLSAIDEERGSAAGHNDILAAVAPLLPPAVDIHAIVDRATRIAVKRVFRQLMVGLVLLIPELAAVALAGGAIRELHRVKTLPDGVHIAV
jgi:hypothetical protein